MTDEPTATDAKIYMEICASLLTHFKADEVEIDLSEVPDRPFSIWRKVDGDKLLVRLVWGGPKHQ